MRKYFTIRSILFGAAGALFINTFAYPNDFLVRSNFMIGTYLPVSVFGILFFLAVFLRPALRRISPALEPGNRELAAATVIMLASCGVTTAGLMRYFPPLMTGPYTAYSMNQQWQQARVLTYMPDKLVPEGWYREGEDPALDATMTPEQRREKERRAAVACEGYSRGLVQGRRTIWFRPRYPGDKVIPLGSWRGMLLWWAPFLVLFCIFVVAMMVVVHPQWSRNELLPYPIAEFAAGLIERRPDRSWPDVFYQRSFWTAFGVVAVIHMVRWAHAWRPETMINIPLEWRLLPVRDHYPNFSAHAFQSWSIFSGRLYFAAFAFAFFIPTDVSFSLGITPFVLAFMGYGLWKAGYNFNYENLANSGAGAYLGMTAVVLFIGRHYYWNVLRAALGFHTRGDVPVEARNACRLFLVAYAGMIAMATAFGLPVYLAVLVITGVGVMFLVTARILAETGSFFIQTVWKPFDVIFGLMGGRAMGPYTMSVLGVISNLFCWDPRETLSGFVINGLKLCERRRLPAFRTAALVNAVLIPCLVAAFLANLWVNYNGRGSDRYILRGRNLFRKVAAVVLREKADPARFEEMVRMDRQEGVFRASSFLFRLRNLRARRSAIPWLLFGFSAVMFCSFMRIRYHWWMIHPIIFLVWGNGGGRTFSASFLAGCLVKTLIIRFGGGRLYQQSKPLFMGCIVAEIAVGALIMLFNVWYYFHYGTNPVRYYIFPA